MGNYNPHIGDSRYAMFRRRTIRNVHRYSHRPWVMDSSQRMATFTPFRKLSFTIKKSSIANAQAVNDALRRMRGSRRVRR